MLGRRNRHCLGTMGRRETSLRVILGGKNSLRWRKYSSIISWLVIFGALAAYLGRWIGIYPITIIGIVVFSVGLVGLASLTYPIARIGVKAVSEWRRQRSAERAGEV